jgi:hypothetical protein
VHVDGETEKGGWRDFRPRLRRILVGILPVLTVALDGDRVVTMTPVLTALVAMTDCGRNDSPCQHQS